MKDSVVKLDLTTHITQAHEAVDRIAAEYKGAPASILVVSYVPGEVPRLAYYGRVLNATELTGVLARIQHTVMLKSDDVEEL